MSLFSLLMIFFILGKCPLEKSSRSLRRWWKMLASWKIGPFAHFWGILPHLCFIIFTGTICWYRLWQDYIRDLEKEEEEQKKIQKVYSIFIISNFLLVYLPSHFHLCPNIRNNWGGLSGKIVMSFACWWRDMLPLAFSQLKLTGVIIA